MMLTGSTDVSTQWTNATNGVDTYTELTYRYRVVCEPFKYGPQCQVTCSPRDDSLGHYTCDEDGNKVCLHGWQGDYCRQGEYRTSTFLHCTSTVRVHVTGM